MQVNKNIFHINSLLMKVLWCCFIFHIICSICSAQPVLSINKYPLIPYPVSLKETKGSFVFSRSTKISADNYFSNELSWLQVMSYHMLGDSLQVSAVQSNVIIFRKDDNITALEGYRIEIKPDQLMLTAKYPAGMFRALQTLRQLMPVAAETGGPLQKSVSLPAMEITDAPAFQWRGMHLDVARHFFSIAYLRKFIDIMALYKMNKLHLHLTDDQGWRIEIKKYPKLTDAGAWRTFDKNDSACMKASADNPDFEIDQAHIINRDGKTLYGGFYTQQQMKELVAYAASKYIDIIPEIDMPGHMMAAIHAYPYLSCDGGSKWGDLFSTPICPCHETTFEFAEDVFSEIMEIFPSVYLHLGADEVDKTNWAQSPACKTLMEKEGLKNVNELQSYFVIRMEKYFNSKGRKLIGWDEILEGGISNTATIMYWRSWVPDAPVKAVKNGNTVVMSPGNPLYFDNPEDVHSLYNIYHFKVVPEKLTKDESKLIIGAQANIWTENVPSENRCDFLFMPRMTALAERLWSNSPDYYSYLQRLKRHYKRLDALHVHYRLPDLPGIIDENVFIDSFVLKINHPADGLTIRYTTDGTGPQPASTILDSDLVIKKETTIKLAAYSGGGLRGDLYTMHFKKENYLNPDVPVQTNPGLTCSYYKKYFRSARALSDVVSDSVFTTSNFNVPAFVHAPSFGLTYNGFIKVPETGIYTFYLICDDGGILKIGNKEVVNNDGLHAAIQKTGQVALIQGLHPIQVNFIEGGGGFKLQLEYSMGKGTAMPIPENWLVH